jgi:2-methylcitrate synthase
MTLAAPRVPIVVPKKSVALSGVPAGRTALCTVGHHGNDLYYRDYDIRDVAGQCDRQREAILECSLEQQRLEARPVHEYVDLFVA